VDAIETAGDVSKKPGALFADQLRVEAVRDLGTRAIHCTLDFLDDLVVDINLEGAACLFIDAISVGIDLGL